MWHQATTTTTIEDKWTAKRFTKQEWAVGWIVNSQAKARQGKADAGIQQKIFVISILFYRNAANLIKCSKPNKINGERESRRESAVECKCARVKAAPPGWFLLQLAAI